MQNYIEISIVCFSNQENHLFIDFSHRLLVLS